MAIPCTSRPRVSGPKLYEEMANTFHSTSPSVYLELPGTISIEDQCGSLGSALTNPFVAIPPGQLSTYIPPIELLKSGPHGIEYKDLNGLHGAFFLGTVKPLNVAELACPTFGLGIGTSANGDTYTTIGPPYLPIIVPPPQVLSMVPEWQSLCKGFLSYAEGLASFALFDPPRTLTPVAELAPKQSTTPVGVLASPTSELQSMSVPSVVPAQSLVLNSPTPTKALDPAVSAIGPQPSNNLFDPSNGVDSHPLQPLANSPIIDAKTSSANQNTAGRPSAHVPIHGNSDPTVEQGNNAQGLGELIMGAFNGGPLGNPHVSNKDNPSATDVTPIGGGPLAADSPGEQITDDAATAGDPANAVPSRIVSLDPFTSLSIDGSPGPFPGNSPKSPSSIFKVADQVFTASPTGFSVGGVKVVPGQEPVTIAGTPVALRTDGILVLGTSTIPLKATPSPALSVYTIDSQPFTVDPTGFSIGNIKVTPGQEPVTIAGTLVALHTDGALVIGTSTIQLQVTPKPAATSYIVGNEPFTANPSGFVVAGTSILPGGRPATIGGTVVSLDPSGILVIGSSSITLAPKATPSPDGFPAEDQLVTANPTNNMVPGMVIGSGAAAVTISGTPISLSPSHVLYIGNSAITIAPYQFDDSSILTYQGLTFTPLPSGVVAVDGTTLTPGGSGLTIAGVDTSQGLGGDIADPSHGAGGGVGNNSAIVSAFTGGQPRGLGQDFFSFRVRILLLFAVMVVLW